MFSDINKSFKVIIFLFTILILLISSVNATDSDENLDISYESQNLIINTYDSSSDVTDYENSPNDIINLDTNNLTTNSSNKIHKNVSIEFSNLNIKNESNLSSNNLKLIITEKQNNTSILNSNLSLNLPFTSKVNNSYLINYHSFINNIIEECNFDDFKNYSIFLTCVISSYNGVYGAKLDNISFYEKDKNTTNNLLLINVNVTLNENNECVAIDYHLNFINENSSMVISFRIIPNFKYTFNFDGYLVLYEINSYLIQVFNQNINETIIICFKEYFSSYTNILDDSNTVSINIYENFIDIHQLVFKSDFHENIEFNYLNLHITNIISISKSQNNKFIYFYNALGFPLLNSFINFRINGISYSLTTDDKGKASLDFNLDENNFPLNDLNCESDYSIFYNILDDNNQNYTKLFIDDNKCYVKIFDYENETVNYSTFYFEIEGIYYSGFTNNDGIACLDFDLEYGSYFLTIIHPIYGFESKGIIEFLPNSININIITYKSISNK